MKVYAIVLKKNGKLKKGRGFSREELRRVALDYAKALRLRIPVDLRRKTLHEENIERLKEYLKTVEKPERTAE
ncbi:MAG: ribosomal protein L13e [Candidatus Bathyarchaeales archaeon]